MIETTIPHVPVLVVGAGPTGLTLTASLLRYGVGVRILEKKPGLSRFTKASNLMQRSQEVLGALDLHMLIDEIGGPMRGIVYEVHGRSLGTRTMQQPDTPYSGVLLCGQNRLEERVAQGLERSGVQVEFNTELVGVEQNAERVLATIRTAHGETHTDSTISCDYLIGCDGASGPTRTFTKWNFTPHKTGVAARQVDCRLEWQRSATQDQMWLFYFTNGFLAVVPLPGGMYRIATHEPVGNLPSDKPELPEMQAKLRVVTGDPTCRLSDLDWSTHTNLSMGIAGGLRDGRVILAGDSGNPILPNGGQGMNVGILDAFNLGWKLASVVHGGPDALLDTYASERLALRVALEKFQWNSLKYTTLKTPGWLRWVMPRLLEPMLNRGGEQALARVFSQLGEGTRGSAMTQDFAGREAGLRAGDRFPDADIVLNGKPARLFDLIYTGGWSLLAFSGAGKSANVESASAAAREYTRDDLSSHVISTVANTEGSSSIAYDLAESAHRVIKIRQPMLYLVRPDGYIAARSRPSDVRKLLTYADKWIGSGRLSPQAAAMQGPVSVHSV